VNPESIERIGQYRVRRFIASGENADVFEVTDSRFEGQVVRALKLLKPDLSGPKFDRFRADASLLATLDHPNLVTIFDFGLDEATGRHYYAMTYVDGPSLAEQIEANGPLPAGRCIEVFSAVLSGLAELHSHDPAIVHRAIKPSNVLSHSNGHIRLADLGISRADEDTQVTRASPTHGSVRFMSPEQIRGEVVDVRSDIFSVGLAMYEALTGHSPYEHIEGVDPTNDFDIVGCLAACERSGGELDIPAEHMQFPGELAAIIRRALRIAPDARYPDARSMHDALVAATASVDTTLHLSLPRASVNPHEIRQIGHYTIRRFIDEGGMAWVFEVVDSHFKGHEVIRALKLLKPDAAAGAEFQRFQSEAALLAGFDHPNLVTIFEFGQDEAGAPRFRLTGGTAQQADGALQLFR